MPVHSKKCVPSGDRKSRNRAGALNAPAGLLLFSHPDHPFGRKTKMAERRC